MLTAIGHLTVERFYQYPPLKTTLKPVLALTIKIILRYSETNALVPAVLAQSVERVTAEREDAGSIPGGGPKK